MIDTLPAPPTVSARRHLRSGLPAVYDDDVVAMGFLHGLEAVLDRIVATLDSLVAHFDVAVAPDHVIDAVAGWLGVDAVEGLPVPARRALIREAGELTRLRGTRAGLELALKHFFPGVDAKVTDHGGVVVSADYEDRPPRAAPPAFDVDCTGVVDDQDRIALDGCIDRWKPANTRYRLRFARGEGVFRDSPAPETTDVDDPYAEDPSPPEGS